MDPLIGGQCYDFFISQKIGENIGVFGENNICMYVGTANFVEKIIITLDFEKTAIFSPKMGENGKNSDHNNNARKMSKFFGNETSH
jgi:hypothetical protein